MSGKTEKALRRALKTVKAMNALGVTNRDTVAERIGVEETLRENAIRRRKAVRDAERLLENHP